MPGDDFSGNSIGYLNQLAGKQIYIQLMNGTPAVIQAGMANDPWPFWVKGTLTMVYPDGLLIETSGKKTLYFARAIRSIREVTE